MNLYDNEAFVKTSLEEQQKIENMRQKLKFAVLQSKTIKNTKNIPRWLKKKEN